MPDSYQRGSDEEWLKHSNAELAQIIKKRDTRIRLQTFFIAVLLLALGWTVFKFAQSNPIGDLMKF